MPQLPPAPVRPLRMWSYYILVLFSFLAGVFLFMAPWNIPIPLFSYLWDGIWESNYFLIRYPEIRVVMMNPFLRGAVSGLGLLNILVGFLLIGERNRK